MNHRSDIDRVLQVWMADGPAAISDRVVDVVATRIAVQRQLRPWPFPGRTIVTTQIKIIAALAAALVVAVVGYNLLPGISGPGGQSPAPTATAVATQETTAPPLPDGALTGGRYQLQPFAYKALSLSLVADVPSGWTGHPDVPAITGPGGENVGVLISWLEPEGLFSDPCHWDLDGSGSGEQEGDVEVGATVGDLVAALKANTSYTSSIPTPVTFGQFGGQELELQLPGDDVIRGCDRRSGETVGDYFVFPEGFWALGSDNRWQLFIVDVGGIRVVSLLSYFPGTPEAEVEAGRAIVASFEFSP